MAIDRQRIMTEAMSGYAPPADATGLAESQKRWKDAAAQAAPWTRRNVAEANRLLDAAGLARGADGIRSVPGGGPMRYEIHVGGRVEQLGGHRLDHPAVARRRGHRRHSGAASLPDLERHAAKRPLRHGNLGLDAGADALPVLSRPDGRRAGAADRRGGDGQLPALRERRGEPDPPALRGHVRPRRTPGPDRELQKIYVENAPSLPLFASPLWGVFNTSRFVGFPGRARAYAGASPGQTDTLPALVEIAPR